MRNLTFLMFSLIIVVSCKNNITESKNSIIIDNNHFEFELPDESKELDGDFKNIMLQQNDNILYLAQCDTSNSKFLFMVSKYIAKDKISIEDAFNQSVETITTLNTDSLIDNFQLIDYKTHQVNGITIRYKIWFYAN